ncbi:MAG: NUDIX domain-containing protein [Spirosomataceae bacterium]
MHPEMLELYSQQTKCLVALDSIIFGFDGEELKLLLVKRGVVPNNDSWSLMGGWLQPSESLDQAADRILYELTGLTDVYLEQLSAFGDPQRDPIERTVSITYFALINVPDYDAKISDEYQAQWFPSYQLPDNMLFDHREMVELAKTRLRNKAAYQPIGFELLPQKFTIPQLQKLYEAIYETKMDKRNFSRKILSTKLLVKLKEKQKGFSKKGAFLYSIDMDQYQSLMNSFLNFIPLKG